MLFNTVDAGLFSFSGKRSGAEIFSIMSYGNDFFNTLPRVLMDFWYLLLLFIVVTVVLAKLYPRLFPKPKREINQGAFSTSPLSGIIFFFVFTSITIIAFRGGIQYKPLNIMSASGYGPGMTSSLILNTPFTIIKTFGKKTLEPVKWMNEEEALKLTPVIKFPSSLLFRKINVVVIIMESFGKEYIGALNNGEGYTPFLDSLIGQSLVFSNSYANGKRSIEGIPAIVAGIPALMDDPFITSLYSGNEITSLPSLLKTRGYTSVFYHGGTDGTMGFDNFARLASFDRYYGRKEYNDDKDFDGSWGIYDEPFLQRAANEMNATRQPFFSTIFTLSSHHPYRVPDKYQSIFPKGSLPVHESIGYADFSLKKFFETASGMEWFKNTLFVITGDHTGISGKDFYRSHAGLYSVPIIFYSPSDSTLKGMNKTTAQHIDILPSIMDYLGYDQKFYALGNSLFDEKADHYSISYVDATYQLVIADYLFILDTMNSNSLYNFTNDSTLSNNLAGSDSMLAKKMEIKLKSVVQNFNSSVLHNEMKAK